MSKICLSLNEKIKVIEEIEKGNSIKSSMNTFKYGKTKIYNIIKNKIKIREEWLKGNGKSKRSLKKTVNDEINKAVWDWFVKARSKNIPISGPMPQEKSKDTTIKLGNTDFKGSNDWLECFRKRQYFMESSELIKDYNSDCIYNCDKTGLFFRAIPSKTLKLKGEQCKDGKLSKERITVLLCGNMAGELEKPLVMGKAAMPNKCNSELLETYRGQK
ncbi:hypothetical protein QTP88_004468 [Uroleucon formosanum]